MFDSYRGIRSNVYTRGYQYYCRERALVRARRADETAAALAGDLSFVHEIEHIMLVRIWLAQGEFDKARQLCERLEQSADAGGRHGRALEIRLLHDLALHGRSETAAAFRLLEAALAQAQPEGYLRIFQEGLWS